MRFMNQIRRYATVGMLATAVTLVVATAAQAWTINGTEQQNIPFWYSLKEAVCAYMGIFCE